MGSGRRVRVPTTSDPAAAAIPVVTTIAPRWEWRSFGDRFGPAELVLAALAPTEVVESTETYLLSVGDTTWSRCATT